MVTQKCSIRGISGCCRRQREEELGMEEGAAHPVHKVVRDHGPVLAQRVHPLQAARRPFRLARLQRCNGGKMKYKLRNENAFSVTRWLD